MRPFNEWDGPYIQSEIAPPDETGRLEKKSSDALTPQGKKPGDKEKAELAKQLCAFANTRDGYIVYGIDDDGHFDGGVPLQIGRQDTKEWAEGIVSDIVSPPIVDVEAKTFSIPGAHAADRGVLAIFVPLSGRRPHWAIRGNQAYFRLGSHSEPMPLQIFLDMSRRLAVPTAEIVRFSCQTSHHIPNLTASVLLRPSIRLVSRVTCVHWAFEVVVGGEGASFSNPLAFLSGDHKRLYIVGEEPLFPGRVTSVLNHNIQCDIVFDLSKNVDTATVTASLYVESAEPVIRAYTASELGVRRP